MKQYNEMTAKEFMAQPKRFTDECHRYTDEWYQVTDQLGRATFGDYSNLADAIARANQVSDAIVRKRVIGNICCADYTFRYELNGDGDILHYAEESANLKDVRQMY